jgi:nucleoside-diphosphate-sugar epimerase
LIKKKYNILVSGASGFVGLILIKELLSRGHNVYGLVRNNINYFSNKNYKNILIEDISKRIDFNKNISIDYFYHLAAKTHDRSNNTDEYLKINVLGLKNILGYSSRLQIKKIVMLSSIKVNGEGFLTNDEIYSSQSQENPKDAYGRSKLEAENILKEFCNLNKLSFVILRPPLVYGAGVKGNLNSLMNYIDKNIPMPIVKTKNLRSLVSLSNLVDALILVGLNDKVFNKTYLIADDKPISVEELYKNIASCMNKNILLINSPSIILKILLWPIGKSKLVDKISTSLIVDNTELKKDTNWKSKITLLDEINNMVKHRKSKL